MHVQISGAVDRLTRAYPRLSPQLKKCAAYILEHPSQVATHSMRQVATKADVPPSTMHRLARTLGFNTYNELRDVYRDSINDLSASWPHRAAQLHLPVGQGDIEPTLDAFQQAALRNVASLFDYIDRDVLDRVVRALTGARQVLVVGMHESHAVANYLHHVAAMGFRNWRLATRLNGELTYVSEPLTDDDVVVAIAFQPNAADTIKVVRHARKSGARVVGITDRRTSPLAACADDILLVPFQSPSFFQSYVAATALVEVLVGMAVAHGEPSVVENIAHLERCRREMGEYWLE